MKKFACLIFLFVTLSLTFKAQNATYYETKYGYIPQPNIVEQRGSNEAFIFKSKETKIFAPKNCKAAKYLHDNMEKVLRDVPALQIKQANSHANMDKSIVFVFSSDKKLGEEGYVIDVTQRNILLQANTEAGLFYAVQTFMQMLHTNFALETWQTNESQYGYIEKEIPCQHIEDVPRFSYRGKHLDCARHFFPASYIKKYKDLLAFHKINTFHWHLTDDQGWRIEIKKYPKLAQIASKRKQTLIGHYSDTDVKDQKFDGKEYGGYYTQEEIKDIVRYAEQRHITIIPEIELPGHAQAALAAYPELSCKGKDIETACTWGVFEDVFCTKEATFEFLENVLDEVMQLFPSKYIHIGGDECPTKRWETCPICQKTMKDNGYTDIDQLQGYFTKRIENYLNKHGRLVIGWDEILDKGVNTSTTILSWQGEDGAIKAAKQGNDAIMAASAYLYFNFYQGVAETEPLAIGGYSPLRKVYLYDPVPEQLSKQEAKHIIGMQACTWTEYIDNTSLLEYYDLPRLAALSERAWSKKDIRDYDDFVFRLDRLLEIYKECGFNYSMSHFAINSKSTSRDSKIQVELTSALKDGEIYYTLDGTDPTIMSDLYEKPFFITKDAVVKAAAFRNGEISSPIFRAEYHINKATGKQYEMKNINPQYNGGGANALTDGLRGNKKSYDRWVGTWGKDYDVVLDLGSQTDFNSININFLDEEGSWIFLPKDVKFYISNDKQQWQEIPNVIKQNVKDNPKVVNYSVNSTENARYIKIFAKSIGNCPDNHPGKGYPSHLFADEIEVK